MPVTDLSVPSAATARDAETAVKALRDGVDNDQAVVRIERTDGTGLTVALPSVAFDLLMRVLAHLANGDAVAILPVHPEVTTQQAADMLNVSRPYLIKLLDEGKVTHRRVGTHRRIPLSDLLEFKRRDDAERKAIADELTAEAQRLGLDC